VVEFVVGQATLGEIQQRSYYARRSYIVNKIIIFPNIIVGIVVSSNSKCSCYPLRGLTPLDVEHRCGGRLDRCGNVLVPLSQEDRVRENLFYNHDFDGLQH